MTRHGVFLIAAVSLGAAAVSYASAVWLTNDLSASALGILPAAVLAAALVWYFEWRNDSRRRSARSKTDGVVARR
jgi:cyanate permease